MFRVNSFQLVITSLISYCLTGITPAIGQQDVITGTIGFDYQYYKVKADDGAFETIQADHGNTE